MPPQEEIRNSPRMRHIFRYCVYENTRQLLLEKFGQPTRSVATPPNLQFSYKYNEWSLACRSMRSRYTTTAEERRRAGKFFACFYSLALSVAIDEEVEQQIKKFYTTDPYKVHELTEQDIIKFKKNHSLPEDAAPLQADSSKPAVAVSTAETTATSRPGKRPAPDTEDSDSDSESDYEPEESTARKAPRRKEKDEAHEQESEDESKDELDECEVVVPDRQPVITTTSTVPAVMSPVFPCTVAPAASSAKVSAKVCTEVKDIEEPKSPEIVGEDYAKMLEEMRLQQQKTEELAAKIKAFKAACVTCTICHKAFVKENTSRLTFGCSHVACLSCLKTLVNIGDTPIRCPGCIASKMDPSALIYHPWISTFAIGLVDPLFLSGKVAEHQSTFTVFSAGKRLAKYYKCPSGDGEMNCWHNNGFVRCQKCAHIYCMSCNASITSPEPHDCLAKHT